MKKILPFLCLLLILGSCSRKPILIKGKRSTEIVDLMANIAEFSVLDWSVGTGIKKSKVTKGIRVKVTIPQIPEKDILFLYEKYKIDSWLIRVKRLKHSGAGEVLGYMYAQTMRKNIRNRELRPGTLSNVYFRLVYAAIAPAKRFEKFRCPAFGHNLLIRDVDIENNANSLGKVKVSSGHRLAAKADKVEIAPLQFSVGKKMRGEYTVELALYNSVDKRISSGFMALPDKLVVGKEEAQRIKGCDNFKVPDRPKDKSKTFRFGY